MKKLATRVSQYPLAAEFVFNYNDFATDSVDAVKKTFGSTALLADPASLETGLQAGTAMVFDCIPMPLGAVITGGELIVETAYVGIGASATLNVGIEGSTSALISAYDLDTAAAGARTALTLAAPLLCNGGKNVRMTLAGLTATATAGKVRIRIEYTIDGRKSENCIV